MKTSLAIVLTMLSLTSAVAAHDYGNLSGKSPGRCGVVACPPNQQIPSQYRGQ